MYAVVKAGGKQHRVAVGDVVEVNRLEGEAGDAVRLPALLLVDGRNVVSETAALAKIAVTGEIVGHHKGPKIKILKYKNKTGYRRRIGHRQLLTELLVTDIDDGKPKKAAKADAAKTDTAKGDTAKADTAKADTAKATPAKASKATLPKAADKPSKATKKTKATQTTTTKAAKASKATASSRSSDTDEKKKKKD